MNRREILKAGMAAGSLFLPLPHARVWAQSDTTMKLLRLPKISLVLGNGKYKDAPLKNPANDAAAMGEALKSAGFAVTTKLDVSRAEMAAAIDAYVKQLAARKCVGLFYYAGHGVQLAWKNYMLPVDVEVDTIDDVQKKAVDVSRLTAGLTKAANPLNVIILDACRDNPFGAAKPTQQKGLSQMDAPTHTLLAYATAPGNAASDGAGANGLYTENLLREIKVPEAKIEDVFKRVRLGVRRKSNGAQVPWESTSLEDDFWFIPPKELKKLSDAEKDRLFSEEGAVWDKARGANDVRLIEEYLRRFPTGNFSEIAQLELDRALAKQGEKRIQIAQAEGSPFTKGSASADIAYKVGDSYTYRSLDPSSKVERGVRTLTIIRITDEDVTFDDGLVIDLLGNIVRYADGRHVKGVQTSPLEFSVGRRWKNHFVTTLPNGHRAPSEVEITIAAREKVVVPAGTFDAFRIDARGFSQTPTGRIEVKITNWAAPDVVRLPVRREEIRMAGGQTIFGQRVELVSYQQ